MIPNYQQQTRQMIKHRHTPIGLVVLCAIVNYNKTKKLYSVLIIA